MELQAAAAWASIFSLIISIITLIYMNTIKRALIKFKRQQRLKKIIDDVMKIPDDALPLTDTSKSKVNSLLNTIPLSCFSKFTNKGRHVVAIHKYAEKSEMAGLKESLQDWISFSEEL